MWLSEKMMSRKECSGAAARMGRVTIGGAKASVLLSGENRELNLLTPGGMQWQPEQDAQVMVLETDDGERFILGAAAPDIVLEDGEIALYCGDTMLRLGRDGVWISGRLFVNGAEITAE